MKEEVWRDIEGYEGLYQVSNLGRFKSLPKIVFNNTSFYMKEEKIMKKARYVTLYKDGIAKYYFQKALVNKTFADNIDLISEDLVKRKKKSKEQNKIKKIKPCKVKCITTGKEFDTINQANRFYDIKAGAITRCCKGMRKSAGKLSDGTKLLWKFISD